MHVVEHVLFGMCLAALAVATVHAARGRIAASFGHAAGFFALADLTVALGGIPGLAEAGLAALCAGFTAAALVTARRSTRSE